YSPKRIQKYLRKVYRWVCQPHYCVLRVVCVDGAVDSVARVDCLQHCLCVPLEPHLSYDHYVRTLPERVYRQVIKGYLTLSLRVGLPRDHGKPLEEPRKRKLPRFLYGNYPSV